MNGFVLRPPRKKEKKCPPIRAAVSLLTRRPILAAAHRANSNTPLLSVGVCAVKEDDSLFLIKRWQRDIGPSDRKAAYRGLLLFKRWRNDQDRLLAVPNQVISFTNVKCKNLWPWQST